MRVLFCIFLIGFFLHSEAQPLARKAWLGAQVAPNSNEPKGILINTVVSGTAAELKLESGDILLALDQKKLADLSELQAHLATKRAGDKVTATILRNQKTIELTGIYIGRPLETDDISEVIYDAAPFRGGQLRVIINKPKGEGKQKAMLFIPGYTCSSIDNLEDIHPYKRIIDAYVKAGYVTLRVEKSGLGDSQNTPECESCNLLDEVENFEQGLLKLKSLPYVDTSKIIIVGHSMGGIIVPAISAKHQVAGVVVYGTIAKSWFEYAIEMTRLQNQLAGMNPIDLEQSVQDQYEMNYRFYVKKEKLEDISKDSIALRELQLNWQYDAQGRIFGRNPEYWRQIQDYPHVENWKNTQAKVLVQFGESDFQAFSKADHAQIVWTVNYYHPGHATLKTYPQTDHYFAKSGTMQEAYNKFAGGQYMDLFNAYNFEVGNSAVAWSDAILNDSVKSTNTSKQWQKLNTASYPGKQDDIDFVNEQEGWYVNGSGAIYHTTDAGATWTQQVDQKGTFFRCIAFMDSLRGFAGTVGTDYFPNVTDTIPLYQTIDGGKTWTPVNYKGPYVKGLCAIDIVKKPYINHGVLDYKYHIYAVGRVGSPANSLISHDAGKSWTSTSMDSYGKMLFDIKMFDTKNGFACSASSADIATANALILRTKNGGRTWEKVYQSNRPMEITWKMSFPTEKIGYVTIQSYDPNNKQQRVAKTTDGGATWTEINLCEDAAAREFGIGFLDELHGFVGTMNSGYETLDGGKSWQAVDMGKACNKIRIYKDNKDKVYGYAIGVEVFKW